MSSRFVKAMLEGHSMFGLVAAALLYNVCLTGVVSVFAQELQRWERPAVPRVDSASLERMAEVLELSWRRGSAEGEVGSVMVFGPEAGLPQLRGRAVGAGFERVWAFGISGEAATRVETPATTFITELHGNLHAPPWGGYVVGLSGVALLSLIVSGLLSHPRIFKDAFRLRRGGSRRLQEADLHNRLSVWAAPFHLAIAVSGAFLGLATVLGGAMALVIFAGDMEQAAESLTGESQAAQVEGSAAFPDVPAMARAVQRADPDSEVRFILVSQPGQAAQRVYVDVVSGRQLASGESYTFDGDGTPHGPAGFFDGSLAQQTRAAMVPLHYGSFGGLAIKWLYALLGIALCAITSTGVSVWAARKRDIGQPAAGWERTWTAFVWGQVTALAITIGVALFGGTGLMLVYLGVAVLMQLTALASFDQREFMRAHRVLAGLAVLLLPAVHAVQRGVGGDIAALWVSMCLGATGALLIAAGISGSGRPRSGA